MKRIYYVMSLRATPCKEEYTMKKALIFALSLMMLVVFAVGCSSKDDAKDTATEAPTVEATTEATEEPAADDTAATEEATDDTAATDEPAETESTEG